MPAAYHVSANHVLRAIRPCDYPCDLWPCNPTTIHLVKKCWNIWIDSWDTVNDVGLRADLDVAISRCRTIWLSLLSYAISFFEVVVCCADTLERSTKEHVVEHWKEDPQSSQLIFLRFASLIKSSSHSIVISCWLPGRLHKMLTVVLD